MAREAGEGVAGQMTEEVLGKVALLHTPVPDTSTHTLAKPSATPETDTCTKPSVVDEGTTVC